MTKKEQSKLNKRKYKRRWLTIMGMRHLHDPKNPCGFYTDLDELDMDIERMFDLQKDIRISNKVHQRLLDKLKRNGVFTLRMTKDSVNNAMPDIQFKDYSYVFVKGKRFVKDSCIVPYCSSRRELLNFLNSHLELGCEKITTLENVVLIK